MTATTPPPNAANHSEPRSLGEWALFYAGLGWPVHPLAPGSKKPLLEKWPRRATTDPDVIRDWWARWPRANIGLAAGSLVVVHLDVKAGHDGLGIPADTVTSRTPSGGLHLIYDAGGAKIGSSAGRPAPGILAWLLRGCLACQRKGLNPPPAVKAAADETHQSLPAERCATSIHHPRFALRLTTCRTSGSRKLPHVR